MRKLSKVHPNYKARYRVTNWSSYDRGLVKRGSLTVWFSPEAINAWTPKKTGRRGGQRRYSDVAIQTALHHLGGGIRVDSDSCTNANHCGIPLPITRDAAV